PRRVAKPPVAAADPVRPRGASRFQARRVRVAGHLPATRQTAARAPAPAPAPRPPAPARSRAPMHGARTGRLDVERARSFVSIDKGQAPAEFAPKQLEEVRTSVELHQLNREAGSGNLDFRAWVEVAILLPVARKDCRRVGQAKRDA